MGKKKNNNHNHGQNADVGDKADGQQREEVQKNNKNEGGGRGKNPMTVVLKIEMHCGGCASKIIKLARSLDGVESVIADAESNKLTVIGFVDPSQIRDTLHDKTKKKVDLISPQPKKEDKNNKDDNNNKKNKDQKSDSDNKKSDADNKKPKDAPVTTAVFKVAFDCQGCIEKIYKTVSKTKGVQETSLDKEKETVTVKGTMDVKALTEALKDRLKRPVVIVPPPKKEKDGAGGNSGENGGGGKKKGGGGDAAAAKMEENRMEHMMQSGFGFGAGPGFGNMGQPVNMYGNGYGYMGMPPPPPQPVYDYGYGYGYGYVPGYPEHMKFTDENPTACSVM